MASAALVRPHRWGCISTPGHSSAASRTVAIAPYAVPGKATRLAGLPPALVLSGHDDPMRDEAVAYASRLRDAGIEVTTDVLPNNTGWPESLTESPPPECPCATAVREHLRTFFYP